MSFEFGNHSHRRFNPLTNAWVLCSPHRTQRPWQGQAEGGSSKKKLAAGEVRQIGHDPKCYLCPRNTRMSGDVNPDYENTFVFENDFPAVKKDQPEYAPKEGAASLLQVESVRGECHVICFSPDHEKTMADMSEPEIVSVIDTWVHEYEKLKKEPYINHVQIFENKGAIMGCSNPHPHGQVWATEDVPQEPATEIASMGKYFEKNHSCLLCDYVKMETTPVTEESAKDSKLPPGSRVVCENDSFLCVVPFWAVWPFETMVVSKHHCGTLTELNETQRRDLANILRRITCRYDNLFECQFPYSMGVHQAPTDGQDHSKDTHLHLHFYPPLLRSATIKKFLVGFELMGQAQRDLTPEQAAARLVACSEVHYTEA